jgi:hypothetical protein
MSRCWSGPGGRSLEYEWVGSVANRYEPSFALGCSRHDSDRDTDRSRARNRPSSGNRFEIAVDNEVGDDNSQGL